MPRSLTSAALAQIAATHGTEPIIILELVLVTGSSVLFSDKRVANIPGKILQVSGIDDVINLKGSKASASMSVVIDDTNGVLKSLIDKYDLHNRPISVYQYFEGMNLVDKFLVFAGKMTSPIAWSEANRTVSFDILSEVRSAEVGFSPEEGQFRDVPDDLVGKVWPTCFGTVIHVPGTEIRDVVTGQNLLAFGLPDATLAHKIRLLNIYGNNILLTYQYYYYVMQVALALTKPPLQVQDEYMDHIINEDYLKQLKEDTIGALELTHKQTDYLLKRGEAAQYEMIQDALDSNESETNSKEYWRDKLVTYRQYSYGLISNIQETDGLLQTVDWFKKASEIDGENAKYTFDFVGDLREKMVDLIEQYFQLQEDLIDHQRALLQQATMLRGVLLIDGGYKFPQDQPVIINIDNILILGSFTGDVFTVTRYMPTYINLPLIVGAGSNDTFYLQDPNNNIQGMYALTDTGHVVQINSQDGAVCTISLVKVEDVNRTKQNFLDNTPANLSQIKNALENLLTGNESPAQILATANEMPRDISRYAWEKLQGTLFNTQVLTTNGYAGGGTFKLIYDEYTTTSIPYDATALEIRNIFLDLPPFLSWPVNTDKIEITGGPIHLNPVVFRFRTDLWTDDFDPFPKVMHPITVDFVDLEGKVTEQYINPSFGTYIGGDTDHYTLTRKGKSVDITLHARVAEIRDLIYNNGLALPSEVEISGGPVYTFNELITFTATQGVTLRIKKGEVFTHADTNDTTYLIDKESHDPLMFAYRVSDGAREHTLNEQNQLIFEEFENTVNYPMLKKLKTEIIKLFNLFHSATNEQEREDIRNIFYKRLDLYVSESNTATVPDTTIAEAFRLISDQEYKFLFEMQLLHYIDWRRSQRPLLAEVDLNTDTYYFLATNFTRLVEVSPVIQPTWLASFDVLDDFTFMTSMKQLPNSTPFVGNVGAQVSLVSDYQKKFVANTLPSTVHAVYAYRYIDGVRFLTPVPSRYYVKNESDSNYPPLNCTTITLKQPLSRYVNEFWDDGAGIFVTLTSSQGPNTVDIIEWVINHYTNLSKDSSSFSTVRSQLSKYPSNFALLKKIDALKLIEDLAWQSRCAAWVNGQSVYLRYLSVEPSTVHTFDDSNVVLDTFSLNFSSIDDIITKFVCEWKRHYAAEKPNKLILRHNLAKYPEAENSYDFYTYTDRDLVLKSATFWLIRYANIWKKCRFNATLDSMEVETLDAVLLSFANNIYANTDVKAIIEKAEYNSDDATIVIEAWLPVRAGTMTKYDFAWPGSVSVDDIFPDIDIVTGGNAGSGFNPQVPRGINYNPQDPALSPFRPKDYGDISPSDAGDLDPDDPSSQFNEIDYEINVGAVIGLPVIRNANKVGGSPQFGNGTSPWRDRVNKSVENALGRNSRFVGYGRIIGLSDTESDAEYEYEDSDGNTETVSLSNVYDIRLISGRTVRAYHLQGDDVFPQHTVVMVAFEEGLNKYVFQVNVDPGIGDLT